MKYLICFVAMLVLCEAVSYKEQWQLFKAKYKKNYKFRSEENHRFSIFQKNVRDIEEHNANADQGLHTYRLGVNKFADLTPEEFSKWLKRFKVKKPRKPAQTFNFKARAALPAQVDWRTQGAVTDVKDQGDCGSCWAFSATGSMEAAHFFKTKKLISMSEQQLMDCDEYNDACNGGLMDYAFDWIMENDGIQTQTDYPYEGEKRKCRFNNKKAFMPITKYVSLPQGNETSLLIAAAGRPVSVGVDATTVMQFYSSGVMNDKHCGKDMGSLNHGVLVVGYGADPIGGKYWIVKNSWGADWGLNGYMWMSRNKNNQCGIATLASYPIA